MDFNLGMIFLTVFKNYNYGKKFKDHRFIKRPDSNQ
jgi:hypothetical protein